MNVAFRNTQVLSKAPEFQQRTPIPFVNLKCLKLSTVFSKDYLQVIMYLLQNTPGAQNYTGNYISFCNSFTLAPVSMVTDDYLCATLQTNEKFIDEYSNKSCCCCNFATLQYCGEDLLLQYCGSRCQNVQCAGLSGNFGEEGDYIREGDAAYF